jgi:hypothetical protein
MGKKSKHKNKHHKQTTVPTVSPPTPLPTTEHPSRRIQFLTIVGLVLTTIGLVSLIQLRPRPSVSSSPAADPSDWLTSRFTITNDGYLQLNDVYAACFVWKAQNTNGMLFTNDFSAIVSPGNLVLHPGSDGLTVPCEDKTRMTVGPYLNADVAIVLSYRPWPFTFVTRRKLFRFVARPSGGNVIWDKQPSSPMEQDFEEFIRQEPTLLVFQ